MNRFLAFLALFSVLFVAGIWSATRLSAPVVEDGATFLVEDGESTASIIQRLEADGIVRNGLVFRFALKQSGLATKIQPGVHSLDGVTTYRGLIEALTSGVATAKEDVLLLREGETLRHLKAALEQLGHPAAETLYDVTGTPAEPGGAGWDRSLVDEFPFLEGIPADGSLEGYLFPDTYRIFTTATAKDVVRTMLRRTEEKLSAEGLLDDIAASGRTMYETMTMASIVEREVRDPEDMARVADLFWRRYDAGMGLQADSTLNYAIQGKDPSLTYDQTKIDSPYNTYKYRGLPYGPIGNPGIDAIRAAVHPEPNDAWYFLTDAEGTVHYGRTLEEHNANKRRYLR